MNRERTYKTEAVILRRRNWGEADRILTLFTPYRGKIRVRAAGVRKPASRKAGHLELFCRSQLFLAQARDLDIVTQAEAIETHSRLRDDLLRSASASYVAELMDRFSPEGAENISAYRLLISTLDSLCGPADPGLLLRWFDLRLMETMGYKPELFACVIGKETIQAEDQFFSPPLGGVVCPHCERKTAARFPVTTAGLRLLRHLQKSGVETLAGLQVQSSTLEQAERILQGYIHYLLEQPLRSREFIHKVG